MDADPGVLDVVYQPGNSRVQIWTYTTAQNWVQHGADISVSFASGDQFGARAKSNGDVEVYKNGSLVGTRSVTAWPYYASGGYIGLWMINASNVFLDDFGGGDVVSGPTATPTATHTATPAASNTPTATETATPTATVTATLSSFPVTGILDNFNRSNSTTLGTNWTAWWGVPSQGIQSNRAANRQSSGT